MKPAPPLVCFAILAFALVDFCRAQSPPGGPSSAPKPSETPTTPVDINTLKQQLADLQAQLAVLQAKASVAQSTADAAQSGAKETAANQAAIAQAQATIAQANRNAITATYPTSLVTPLEGKMTVDANYKFPPQVLTYTASDKMITGIVEAMLPFLAHAQRVVVFSAADIGVDQRANNEVIIRSIKDKTASFDALNKRYTNFKSAEATLEDVSSEAKRVVDKIKNPDRAGAAPLFAGADTALTGVNSTVQSMIQLISLFRTDTTIAGVATDVDVEALEAQFCFHLLYDDNRVLRAGSLKVETPSGLRLTSSVLLDAIQRMQTVQSQNAANVNDAKARNARLTLAGQAVQDTIKKLMEKDPPETTAAAQQLAKSDFQNAGDELAALTKGMTDLDTAATTLVTALETPDSKTGLFPLAGILKTEALSKSLESPGTFRIALKTVGAGGATRITRNLFTGSKLTELGGTIFLATLSDSQGKIVYSNASKGFVGFTKVLSTTSKGQQDIPPEHHFLWWHWPGKTTPPFSTAPTATQ